MSGPDDAPAPGRPAEHSSPYPLSRLAPAFDRGDLNRELAQADQLLSARTRARLQVIAQQILHLRDEAQRVLEEARRDAELHHARCGFKKVPGRVYHLYRQRDGGLAFSLLSPHDWGGHPPHPYLGAFRLEPDLSWVPAQQPDAPEDAAELVQRLLRDDIGESP